MLNLLVSDPSAVISQSLLEAVLQGDEQAWKELVEALYPMVASIIRNHLRREADREDVAQEVFVKIFANIGQYQARQPFDHWVARIALNACHDWLRRLSVRPAVTYSDLGEAEREIIERTLADDQTCHEPREMLCELLERLIATLSPREQIVIRLLDLEGRSVAETSELTGWGASKIKVTAMRARRKLTEKMRRLEPKT